MAEKNKTKQNILIEEITPEVYGVNSGGAHLSGTFMNVSNSSNMFTAKI